MSREPRESIEKSEDPEERSAMYAEFSAAIDKLSEAPDNVQYKERVAQLKAALDALDARLLGKKPRRDPSEVKTLIYQDDAVVREVSAKLSDPEGRDVMSPDALYGRYVQVLKKVDATLTHAHHVDEKFQGWHSPMKATDVLEKVYGHIQQLEPMADQIRREIDAALVIHESAIMTEPKPAVAHIALQPKHRRIAAESILNEYEKDVDLIENQLKQEELIRETK